MPIYELICLKPDCSTYEQPVERLCRYDERLVQTCRECQLELMPILSATPGYVRGGVSNRCNGNINKH